NKENNEENHHHTHNHPTKKDANSKAIMLHLLEDVLGWVAVLVGAAIMYFTQWYWIDSVLTIGIALFITYNAITNLVQTFKILLQKVPDDIFIDTITSEIKGIEGIDVIKDIKIWSIDGISHVANIKIKISSNEVYITIQNTIRELLIEKFNITESTIEIQQ